VGPFRAKEEHDYPKDKCKDLMLVFDPYNIRPSVEALQLPPPRLSPSKTHICIESAVGEEERRHLLYIQKAHHL
jgi:hypothetical protein